VREFSPIFPFNKYHMLISLIGRDQDYQNLNLAFTVNLMKIATIISMFPKPLKLYVVTSCHESV
jgi:hypothetical protein